MIRVARISSLPSVNKPGMGLAALRLSQYEEVETHIISYVLTSDSYPDEVSVIKPTLYPFDNPTMPKSRKGLWFMLLQFKRIFAVIRFAIRARSRILKIDPDIIHIHSPMHFLIGIWARRKGIPTFLTFHGTDYNRVVNSRFYQVCLSRIEYMNCVSSHQVDKLKKLFPLASVTLVSNAVDFDTFTACGDAKENKIVAVGTLRWQKGFFNLISIFAKISERASGWKLVIVGDGPEKSMLIDHIENLKMSNRVSLTGALSRKGVAHELQTSRIFALSSVTEGLPKALLEGMRSRCACIAFNVGDCKRVLTGCGLVVDEGDQSEFANELLSLIEDEKRQDDLAAKAFDRTSEFSWSKYQYVHLEQYKRALSSVKNGNANSLNMDVE